MNPSAAGSGASFGKVPTVVVQAPSNAEAIAIAIATRPSAGPALMLVPPLPDMVHVPRFGIPSLIGIGAFLALTIIACNPDAQTLRADLTLYLQRANDWAPTEAETARTIDRILATQFVDEAEVRRQVGADAPRVTAHLERIQAVHPASPEVRDIHQRYVSTWRRLDAGYAALLRGLDTGHVPDIAIGRQALEAWRDGIVGVAGELRRLRADTGI